MILLLRAHPDPDSWNAALAAEIAAALTGGGYEITAVDLYYAGAAGNDSDPVFPPLLKKEELQRKTSLDPAVQTQMRLVEEAEGYVVVHPDWWGGPPAVLKGWLDRVLRPGTAYEYEGEVPEARKIVGLLTGRRALVVVTGDAEDPGPLTEFWEQRVWGYCGARGRLLYAPRVRESSARERGVFRDRVIETLNDLFPARD